MTGVEVLVTWKKLMGNGQLLTMWFVAAWAVLAAMARVVRKAVKLMMKIAGKSLEDIPVEDAREAKLDWALSLA